MKGDKPCKVISLSTFKTGKHGHAKCNFTAVSIFDGKKHEDIIPSSHTAQVPVIAKEDYMLNDIDEEGFCTLMSEKDASERSDIKLPEWPEGLDREIKKLFDDGSNLNVTVFTSMNHSQIMSYKEIKDD